MGAYDHESQGRRDGRGKARSEGRERAWGSRKARGTVELEALDAGLLYRLLKVLLDRDGALRIGRSRDRGAWAFGLYLNGEVRTEYVGFSESTDEWLAEAAEYVGALGSSDEGGE